MRGVLVLLALLLALTACGGHEVGAASVQRAFASQGIRLERDRRLERWFRAAAERSADQNAAMMLGREVVVPRAIFKAGDLWVAVLPHKVPRKTIEEARGALGPRARGDRIYMRGDVVAIASAERGSGYLRRIRAALDRT